jgi:transglutaminase-like putative cysteine protease
MAVRYKVAHKTEYVYSTVVATSQHVAYLCPRELGRQHVREHALRVDPTPARSVRRTDYFGNLVDQFQIVRPHSKLTVSAESIVDVVDEDRTLDASGSPPWEDVSRQFNDEVGAIPPEIYQFVCASPYVPLTLDVEALGRLSFSPGRSLVDGAIDLMHRIHARFVFDASATVVTTPLSLVLERDRGVCQDFAHVAIACLRSLGLAARYVSGYLLTDPPPGQPRLIGADASHAWLSIYCPAHGWVDLDPTNDVVVGRRHVVLAWGRDYGDVTPLRGVLLGGAEHTLTVGVSVLPLEDIEAPAR